LLAAARRGDDPAWAKLYGLLAGPLLGYLRGQGADDPEDLVGEVFLDVVRGLSRFAGDEAGFRAWVFTIAHRRLTDQRRARGRRPVEPVDAAVLEAAMPTASLEPDVMARLTTDEVVSLLQVLTDDQREVLLLRLVGGLSTAEVAEVTARDPEAVKGLAKRGLAQLRRRLAPPPENAPPAPAPDEVAPAMTEKR
jgi:RNA polymerase sigma factor (sigma-70 family)